MKIIIVLLSNDHKYFYLKEISRFI